MKKTNSSNKLIILISTTVIVTLLLLTMYQIDRQLKKIQGLESTLTEQTFAMAQLQKQVGSLRRNGVNVANTNTPSPTSSVAFNNAVTASKKENFATGDWKISAFGNNLKTITPIVSKDTYASVVQSYVTESLITRNTDTLAWQGFLADSWKISDDGLLITFDLRHDVVFSDGVGMTAEDVVFSFNLVMNDKIDAAGLRSYYNKIKSAQATGKYQVAFTFKEPYFEALSLAGGITVLPKHVYQKYLKTPEILNQSKAILIGTGPYMLPASETWTPDKSSITLVQNPRYWGPVSPPYEKIVWRIIQNDSARLTAFRNSEIDSYSARPLEFKKLKQDSQLLSKSKHFSYMPINTGYNYIAWSQREQKGKPNFFKNKLVRQAMTYLIDREKIKKDIFLNHAEVAISPFNPRSKQHDPKLHARKYNLEKGLALLKQAGFEDRDNDGLIESSTGEPFSFELVYPQSSEDTKRMVLLIKDLLTKAKIELKPKPTEWPVLVEKLENKDFQAILLGWSSGLETDIFQMFHSSQAKTKGDNFVSYSNKDLDQLIDTARATVNEKKRMPIWQKAEAVMYEDQPYTFLFRRNSLTFIDKRFQNVEVTKFGLNSSFLPIETYVTKSAQLHP